MKISKLDISSEEANSTYSNIKLEEAVKELKEKTISDIQKETAEKWKNRALAAIRLGKLKDFEEYFHEALEHSALVDDNFQTLNKISKEIKEVI